MTAITAPRSGIVYLFCMNLFENNTEELMALDLYRRQFARPMGASARRELQELIREMNDRWEEHRWAAHTPPFRNSGRA